MHYIPIYFTGYGQVLSNLGKLSSSKYIVNTCSGLNILHFDS